MGSVWDSAKFPVSAGKCGVLSPVHRAQGKSLQGKLRRNRNRKVGTWEKNSNCFMLPQRQSNKETDFAKELDSAF